MKLLHRLFAWNDRRRARHFLQEVCDDCFKARLALDDAKRTADRALQDAQRLETERFRIEFFGGRDPVRTAFIDGSAKLFGITKPTRMAVNVLPLAAIGPTKYRAGHYRTELMAAKEAA